MQANELEQKLLVVREVVDIMREAGMEDLSIIKQFGLNPVELGAGTKKVLRAIKQGKIKPDDTLQAMANKLGFKSHNAIIYHIKKLKKNGYIA